jgi:hypothetical protein
MRRHKVAEFWAAKGYRRDLDRLGRTGFLQSALSWPADDNTRLVDTDRIVLGVGVNWLCQPGSNIVIHT